MPVPELHPAGPRPAAPALAALALLALLAACQSAPPAPVPPTTAEAVGELRPGSGAWRGYLPFPALPNSRSLLGAPPAEGSAQAAADLATHRATRLPPEHPRRDLAARDADLKFPALVQPFACALGVPISAAETPHLATLMRRSAMDAGLATYAAKNAHRRQRPFAVLGEASCTPAEEAALRNDGSYPSGHAALGWALGLVLAGLAPERAQALVERGHAYGQSRVYCGVHWQSDVDAGRVVGAAAVARLQADPMFRAQAALAQAEIQAQRAKGAAPGGACPAEAEALRP